MLPHKLINFVLFQTGWFACVLSSAAGRPWLGALTALAILAWHIVRAQRPSQEVFLILIAMLVGTLWDSVLVWQSWLQYPAGNLLPNMAPYWIVVMWALFASTLNLSLRWLKQHLLLAIVLGAVAGPLAYYAGARLGAVDFVHPLNAIVALSIGWAVLTPLLILISNRFDGYTPLARRHA